MTSWRWRYDTCWKCIAWFAPFGCNRKIIHKWIILNGWSKDFDKFVKKTASFKTSLNLNGPHAWCNGDSTTLCTASFLPCSNVHGVKYYHNIEMNKTFGWFCCTMGTVTEEDGRTFISWAWCSEAVTDTNCTAQLSGWIDSCWAAVDQVSHGSLLLHVLIGKYTQI